MSCTVKKSKVLTSRNPSYLWVKPDRSELDCLTSSVTCLAGVLGSQASPIPFSKLHSFLSKEKPASTVQINFMPGTYGSINESNNWNIPCHTLILNGSGKWITSLLGSQRFDLHSPERIILQNLECISSKEEVVTATNVQFEINEVVLRGKTLKSLLHLRDCKTKVTNVDFFQEGKGNGIHQETTHPNILVSQWKNIQLQMSKHSGSGFFTNVSQGGQLQEFLSDVQIFHEGNTSFPHAFSIKNQGGILDQKMDQFHCTSSQLSDYVFKIENSGGGKMKLNVSSATISCTGPSGSVYFWDCSGPGTMLQVRHNNVMIETDSTIYVTRGSGTAQSNYWFSNSQYIQRPGGHLPCFERQFEGFHQAHIRGSDLVWKSTSDTSPLCVNLVKHSAALNLIANYCSIENKGAGGLFINHATDDGKFSIDVSSYKTFAHDGIAVINKTQDNSELDVQVNGLYECSNIGTLKKVEASQNSKITSQLSNIVSETLNKSLKEEPVAIKSALLTDAAQISLSINNQNKRYSLREQDMGTCFSLHDQAQLNTTRLNETLHTKEGTGYHSQTQDNSILNENISNLVADTGNVFNLQTKDNSVLLENHANMITQSKCHIKLMHESAKDCNIINTVSGWRRKGAEQPLAEYSRKEGSGTLQTRITNTTMDCGFPGSGAPLTLLQGVQDETDKLKCSFTGARLQTNGCSQIKSYDSELNIVATECLTRSGDAPNLVEVSNSKVDIRASDFVVKDHLAVEATKCDVTINGTNVTGDKILISNISSEKDGDTKVATAVFSTTDGTVSSVPIIKSDKILFSDSNYTLNPLVEGLIQKIPTGFISSPTGGHSR